MTDISSSDNTPQAASVAAKNTLQQASHWSAALWWDMIKTSFAAWIDDYAPSMGAALSYYTVFSLAPLLVIVISVAGLIFGPDAVRGALFTEINGLMGADAAKGIQDLLSSVSKPSTGIIGSILGVIVLLIGAGFVFTRNFKRRDFQQIIYANLPHLALDAVLLVLARGERTRHLDQLAFFERGGFLAFLFPA